MKSWVKLIESSNRLREILDVYLDLRKHLQSLGFSESDLAKPPTYTAKMHLLRNQLFDLQNSLLRHINDYGFGIEGDELSEYLFPFFDKIDELIPLKDGNNKRNDRGNEDSE